MKILINMICILFALFFFASGCYIGIWTMLVGGIMQLVEACKATPVESYGVAVGIAKIIFFEMPIIFGVILCAGCAKAIHE